MAQKKILLAQKLIRDIFDFPKPGIIFKDISPVLKSPEAFTESIFLMAKDVKKQGAEAIVGIESRGFIFSASIAFHLKLPFVLARKLGKLPYDKLTEEYALEYGNNIIEMHTDSIKLGQKIYIVDDLLATGGTAAAAIRLIEKLHGTVCGIGFLAELSFLGGKEKLLDYHVNSLIKY